MRDGKRDNIKLPPNFKEGESMTVIEQAVRKITGATFATIDYNVPAKTYIRKKATDGSGQVNPLWDKASDIRLEVQNRQVDLGVKYASMIEKKLGRKGVELDFVPEPLENYGKQAHSDGHKLLCQNMDRSKTYLRFNPMQSKNTERSFTLDGADVTDQMKPFMAKKSVSKKQQDAGLDKEEVIEWRTLDIANVKRIEISVLGVEITATK